MQISSGKNALVFGQIYDFFFLIDTTCWVNLRNCFTTYFNDITVYYKANF